MARLIFPLFLLLGGCASLDDVVGGIANTPDWFQERRVEIRGEGYPDLSDVPSETNVLEVGNRLRATEKATRAELDAFLLDPRNQPVNLTSEEIAQRRAELRDAFLAAPKGNDEFLSEAEIKALRTQLRVPPVNKSK